MSYQAKAKKVKNCLAYNWCFLLSTIYPCILFLPIITNTRHFPYDFSGYNYPLIDSVYQEFINSESFLWDQYTYGGIALTSNPQTGLLYIPNLILQLMHYIFKSGHISSYSYALLGISQYCLLGSFSYLLINYLTKSKFIGLLGAIKVSTLGIILANVQHPGSTASFIYFPLSIYCLLKIQKSTKINKYDLVIFIFSLYSTISAGFYPQAASTLLCLTIFVLIYALLYRQFSIILFYIFSLVIAILLNAPVVLSVLFDESRAIIINPDWIYNTKWLVGLTNPFTFNLFGDKPEFDPTLAFMWSGFCFLPITTIGYFNSFKNKNLDRLTIAMAATVCFIVGMNSIMWHENISNILSIMSILRGYNITVIAFIFSGVIFSYGLHDLMHENNLFIKKIYFIAFNTFIILAFYQVSIGIYQNGFNYTFFAFSSIQIVILIGLSASISNQLLLKSLLSLTILMPPLVLTNNSNFMMGAGSSTKLLENEYIGQDKDLDKLLENNQRIGIVAHDANNIEGPFNAFWPSWKIRGASGFQPNISKGWLKIAKKLSIFQTNRRFDFKKIGSANYSDYSINKYIVRSDKTYALNPDQADLIYRGDHFHLYEIKNSKPLNRISYIKNNGQTILPIYINNKGKSSESVCIDKNMNATFESVGTDDPRWSAYLNNLKLKKTSSMPGIGTYKINITEDTCGNIIMKFTDKRFLYGLLVKYATLFSTLWVLTRNGTKTLNR